MRGERSEFCFEKALKIACMVEDDTFVLMYYDVLLYPEKKKIGWI